MHSAATAVALRGACYRNALELVEREGLLSVAFPAISTGAFGFPMDRAAAIGLRTVAGLAPTLQSVRCVRFVLYDQNALAIHARVLAEMAADGR